MRERAIAGLVLLVLGVGFLLQELRLWNFGTWLGSWWPLGLVIAGALLLLKRRQQPVPGLVLLLVGFVFLAFERGLFPFGFWDILVPAGLIALGLWILLQPRGRPSTATVAGGTRQDAADDRIDRSALFGGAEIRCTSRSFRGGRASATFGGVDLDLRGAELAPEGAQLEASALFGSVTIKVPATWRVQVSGTPILGGVEDKAAHGADGPLLDIRTSVAFGGVEIRN